MSPPHNKTRVWYNVCCAGIRPSQPPLHSLTACRPRRPQQTQKGVFLRIVVERGGGVKRTKRTFFPKRLVKSCSGALWAREALAHSTGPAHRQYVRIQTGESLPPVNCSSGQPANPTTPAIITPKVSDAPLTVASVQVRVVSIVGFWRSLRYHCLNLKLSLLFRSLT